MDSSEAMDWALATIPEGSPLWTLDRDELAGAVRLLGALCLGEMIDEIEEVSDEV